MLLWDEIEGRLPLFGKQRLALSALALNLLSRLGITHQLRLNRLLSTFWMLVIFMLSPSR